jgi:hypothetical protein
VKLIWTVDAAKSKEFSENYLPSCDMILIQINWNSHGGFYLIPKEVQLGVLKSLGRTAYIKLPKTGTNPRGVELSKQALQNLVQHKDTIKSGRKFVGYEISKEYVELAEKRLKPYLEQTTIDFQ